MDTNEYIKLYLIKQGNNNYDFLEENSLLFLCNDLQIKSNVAFFQNNLNYLYNQKTLCSLVETLNNNKIDYIAFKGICLAHMLYENPSQRIVGDIDIYVDYDSHIKAINVFEELNAFKTDKSEKDYIHHIGLSNGKTLIELHKHILSPLINIKETYLKNNTITLIINNTSIVTFSITATFLHLIYHLYMDAYLTYIGLYVIVNNKSVPQPHRFLYRAYEIALFSEKYFESIKWEEIIEDIKSQKFRMLFKKMIEDILMIFPAAFSKEFIETIYSLNYINDEIDIIYTSIIESKSSVKNSSLLLSNYIDSRWHERSKHNIQIFGKGLIELNKVILLGGDISSNFNFNCKVSIEGTDDGVNFVFNITNDDFCFSDTNDYNTLTSDGVHMIICGTEKYSYNSIFLFPKYTGDNITVIPVDVTGDAHRSIEKKYISAKCKVSKSKYTITAVLEKEFLRKNNIEKSFYLGLVISNCTSKTKKRVSELILTEPYTEWYNPVCFAKIILC